MWWTHSRPLACAAGSRAKDARIIRGLIPRPVSLGLRLGTKNWENPRFYHVLPYRFYHETSGFKLQRSLYPWENHFNHHKMTLGSLTRSGWSWNTWSGVLLHSFGVTLRTQVQMSVVDESGWRQFNLAMIWRPGHETFWHAVCSLGCLIELNCYDSFHFHSFTPFFNGTMITYDKHLCEKKGDYSTPKCRRMHTVHLFSPYNARLLSSSSRSWARCKWACCGFGTWKSGVPLAADIKMLGYPWASLVGCAEHPEDSAPWCQSQGPGEAAQPSISWSTAAASCKSPPPLIAHWCDRTLAWIRQSNAGL